jgi:hypothetical protein
MGQASLMSQVLPQDEDQRIRMPDLPAAYNPSAFDYQYTVPTQPIPMSMGMPMLNLQPQEFGIVDPTYLAQLAILNQATGSFVPTGTPTAPVGLLGSGLGTDGAFMPAPPLVIPNYRPMAQQFRREEAAAAAAAAGGGGGGDYGSSAGSSSYSDPNSYTGGLIGDMFSSGTYAPVVDMTTINGQPSPTYGSVSLGGDMGPSYGGVGGGYEGSIDNSMSQSGMLGAQEAGFNDSDSGGGDSGGGGKIVCTAMNQAYGFGSFRNRIWLAYSAKNLTKAHEAGYHALFLPLVNAGYKQDKWFSKPLRAALENIARHRSADLRAEMRGGKRDRVGQAYRFILEPLCYAVGKLKGY